MISLVWLALSLAAINRVRGGGCSFFNHLPGHTRLWAAALVAVACIPVGVVDAIVVAACYLAWAFLPWGRWYDLGALEGYPNRPPSRFEEILSSWFSEDATAFTIRNIIGLAPAAVLVHPLFLLLALFQTAAYGLGWSMSTKAPIRTAEYLTGALWGLFVWLLV